MKLSFRNTLRRSIGYLPFMLCFTVLLFTPIFEQFVTWNAFYQIVLFIGVVCIPAYFTKRMSYVDIAWPWGLVLIGILILVFAEGYWLRTYCIAAMYIFCGLRMGMGALILFKKGHLDTELSRYQFQRIRWEKQGYSDQDLSLQYEIMIQCFANITFLAMPAILQAFNPQAHISFLEILGYSFWFLFLIMEHVADLQKQAFLKKSRLENKKRQVCNVGLWKYSRHPNYFAEWMVWNALILTSIPSLIYHQSNLDVVLWIGLLVSLLYVSRIMYTTLVYYTGAIPSEYYSVQKRPDYRKHQETTNMFFPGIPKKN